MPDTQVTQADIANLARKLDELGEVLSATERSILLAVFKLASASITARVQGGGSESAGQTESGSTRTATPRPGTTGAAAGTGAASLSSGFREAFKPLGNAEFTLRDRVGEVAGGVGIGVIW